MRNYRLAAVLVLGSVTPVLAGPMPILPDLPPLPTTYEHIGGQGGFYAGILGGYSSESRPALGVVLGNMVFDSTVQLGIEGVALISRDDVSVDGGLRASAALTDSVSMHGYLGLGYSSATHSYAAIGGGAEFSLTADVSVRLDYRYRHDLSGDPAVHTVLTGVLKHF